MPGGLRIGRIVGIPVTVSPSVLVVAALLTWSLAVAQLPDLVEGQSTAMYWFAGAAAAGLFLASLMGHEIAHALVAKREGVEVMGLSLWLFGGVAYLGREAPTPGADMRIALAGPLTSVAFALTFAVLAGTVDAVAGPDLVVAVAGWLAIVNLVLAAFNLIPGAPLDGGRVLRAHLWHRSGDRTRAAVTAARWGRWVGRGIAALGVVEIVVGLFVSGIWLIFIGWFISSAAAIEESEALLRRDLRALRVSDAMRAPNGDRWPIASRPGARQPLLTAPDEPLDVVRDRLLSAGLDEAFVVERGFVIGRLTLADVMRVARRRPAGSAERRPLPPPPPPPGQHRERR